MVWQLSGVAAVILIDAAKQAQSTGSTVIKHCIAMTRQQLEQTSERVSIPKLTSNQIITRVIRDLSALWHDTARLVQRVVRVFTGMKARVLYLVVALAFMVTGFGIATKIALDTMNKYQNSMGNPSFIMNTKNTGTTILDRNGEVLFQGYGAVTRHNIPLEEMPDTLKQATLATEDPDFYNHAGFSWRGTARALYQDLRHNGKVQGGSTITQQLVKNTLLTNEKSLTRKYKEVILSMEMERRYSKDQILQMYLNTIYYGQGAYGVESASETYFHKPAKELTLEESALLAGLPQSPSLYDPNVDPSAAKQRRDYVLSRMQEHGYVSKELVARTELMPVKAGTRDVLIKAPHFVFYVLDQLQREYGQDMLEHGGIVVHTSLDLKKQEQAEQIVQNQVNKLAGHHATNGGLVSIDPHTGDIVSMVGSVDYNQPGFGAVNVTLAQLQPGSSFKPIAYATAFTKGWNGATEVNDKPIQLPQGDGTIYAPQNYDQKFRGPVLLRRALANSLNIPAVEVLQFAGLHDTIAMAHNLGITEPSLVDENRYGLSLVLGGGEVRPIDMAKVYAAFANQGRTVTPRAIVKVNDKFGQDITKPTAKVNHQAIDPRIAYMITNILSDNGARTEEFGPNSPLVLSRPAAAKTGTTNDFRDNWTVGYTPDLVTAVWVGNNDHSPMTNVDGITGAAPIWHDYMEMAVAGSPVHQFVQPAGVVLAKICSADGGLTDPNDPKAVNEVFLAENQPTKKCGWSGAQPKPQPIQAVNRPVPSAPAPVQQAQAPAPAIEGGRGGGPAPSPGPGDGWGGPGGPGGGGGPGPGGSGGPSADPFDPAG
jgi:1A family penicillin-binding protein